MICYFKKTFLKDLAEVPGAYRSKIERLVFEDIPSLQHITDKIDIKKIQGYESYYRIRMFSRNIRFCAFPREMILRKLTNQQRP